jgi:hypothetical protein
MFLVPLILASLFHAGPERAIAPAIRDGPPYNQYVSSVAAADDVALVAWSNDDGSGYAVRVDRNGQMLDARPVVLGPGASGQPHTARGRDRWIAVWATPTTIDFRFILDDGSTSEALPLTASNSALAGDIDVAFDGTHYLVTWTTAGGIAAIRLDAQGVVVERDVQVASGSFYDLDIVPFGGGGFAVLALRTWHSVESFRLDTNADFLSQSELYRTTTAIAVRSVYGVADKETLVATWFSADSPTGGNIFVAREGQPLRTLENGTYPYGIVKIGGGVYILAAAQFEREVALISEDGTRRRTIGTATIGAAAESFGDAALVATTVVQRAPDSLSVHGETDVALGVVDGALQDRLPQTLFQPDSPLQQGPSVARNAFGESLVAWLESGRAGGPAVKATFLDSAGRAVREPFVIASATEGGYAVPKVASDGTDFLIVWYDYPIGTRTVRLLRDGTLLPPVALPISPSCLAWTGSGYLAGDVRVIRVRGRAVDAEIRATRLSREGVAGETIVVAPEVRAYTDLACAAGDNGTMFVFAGRESVGGAILTDGGSLIAPIELAPNGIGAVPGAEELIRATVAANGDRYLAAWNTYRDTIEWSVVNGNGVASLVPEQLETGPGLVSLDAAPYRNGHFLAWSTGDLRGVALDTAGRSVASVSISETPRYDGAPVLLRGDTILAAYLRDVSHQSPPVLRVFTRMLSEQETARRRTVRH